MGIFWVCIIIFLSGCAAEEVEIPKLLEPVGIKLDFAVATRSEIYNVFVYDAIIAPTIDELYFTIDGVIETFDAALGQPVQAGEVIATLDQSDLREQIASLNASIEFVEKTLEYQTAIDEAGIRIKELELAKLKAESANSQMETNLLKIEIEELKIKIKHNFQTTQLELNHMRGELETLQGTLGHGKIVAPYAGYIAYSAGMNQGDPVKAHTPLIYIAADTGLWIKSAYITDSLIGSAHALYARIGGEKYPLTYIPAEQSEYLEALTSGGILTSKFAINGSEEALSKLSSGTYAAVHVITDYIEDALTIPANAVYRDDGIHYVYVMQGDAYIRRDVEIGVTNQSLAQITSGLEEGEIVYVKD